MTVKLSAMKSHFMFLLLVTPMGGSLPVTTPKAYHPTGTDHRPAEYSGQMRSQLSFLSRRLGGEDLVEGVPIPMQI
jgi:hypothetical protein